jgi:hypothetical protein
MEQLRLGLTPPDAGNPLSRLVFGLLTAVITLAVGAVLLLIALPVVGIIVSAAVGGLILALAGIVMMVPFLAVAGTVLVLMNRTPARKSSPVRVRGHWG